GRELPINLGKILNGAVRRVREGGNVGGKNFKVFIVPDNAGCGDPRIDRDDAHHLDGALEVGNRGVGGGNNIDKARQVGLFLREGGGQLGRAGGNGAQVRAGFFHLRPAKGLWQCLKDLGKLVEKASAFSQAAADGDEGGFDVLARAGQVVGEAA